MTSMSDTAPVTPLNQLTVDARDLAKALVDGQGSDGLDVIFCGAYCEPADQARLLRATADILDEQ